MKRIEIKKICRVNNCDYELGNFTAYTAFYTVLAYEISNFLKYIILFYY